MEKIWSDDAWNSYLYWQQQDKKSVKKVNDLVKECERTPISGTGKPEPLRHLPGRYWSRRINEKDRFVYKVEDGKLYIASCKGHYE